MTYDHNKKAGNEGDIVKHPALIAAIHSLVSQNNSNEFRYTDIFSGYSFNPICKENEWYQGIGKIKNNRKLVQDQALKFYFDWYLSRPQLIGGIYPGSSTIALDTIMYNKKLPRFTLYDISEKVIENLNSSFMKSSVKIYHRPASASDLEISESDLIFIDPPGVYSKSKKNYPKPNDLVKFGEVSARSNVLIWLPVILSSKTSPPSESKITIDCIDYFRAVGYHITKVKWAMEGEIIGCFLAYKIPPKTIVDVRAAIDDVVKVAGWKIEDGPCVKHMNAE